MDANTLPPGLAAHPDYEVIRELGQGGMGVVYLARNRLMDRLEVLKVVGNDLMDRRGVADRFLGEIRNAAQLEHPNIVTAYAALRLGESIVFAMEFVDGLDLAELVKASGRLPVLNACNYVYQSALGLQHAHERGMVHRDIKPSNLMLTRQANRAQIKILDFGLAKVTSEGTVENALTHEGQMLGTPDYIAPEQTVDAREADTRADIYSLGCTFYHLLTGGPPFQASSLYELLQAHHSVDATPLNLARPEVPAELGAIVAKMMAKEPERRFQSPAEVAQALAPFCKKASLNASVVSANAPMAASRPAPTSASAASPPNKRHAVEDCQEVMWESLIRFKPTEPVSASAPADGKRQWSLAWPRSMVVEQSRRAGPLARWIVAGVTLFGVFLLLVTALSRPYNREKPKRAGDLVVNRVESTKTPVESKKSPVVSKRAPDDPSRIEETNPWPAAVDLAGQTLGVQCRVVAMSPDCRRLALVPRLDKEIMIVEAPDGRRVVKTEGHREYIWGAAFSPDGRHLASRGNDGFVKIWDVATGAEVRRHRIAGISIAYSPDGKRLASADAGGKVVRVWDAATGDNLFTLGAHSNWAWCAVFSPDGKRLASGSGFGNGQSGGSVVGELKLWDLETRTCTNLEGHPLRISGISFSPDGKRLASASFDHTVKLWDVETRQCLVTFDQHRGVAGSARFSPDGQMIASCGRDRPVRVWESASGRSITNFAALAGDRREDWFLQFSKGGRWIYSGTDSKLNAWEAPPGNGLTTALSVAPSLASARTRGDLTRTVTGRWRHSPGERAERTFKADGAVEISGRRLGTWTLDGRALVLTWPNNGAPGGAWVDRCELSADGMSYEGRNQVDTPIRGQKMPEDSNTRH